MTHGHGHGDGHGHGHVHGPKPAGPAQLGALRIAFVVTIAFAIVELVGGLRFGSLALLADAAHMFSDSGALVLALVAQQLALRPPSPTHSFGWRRAEVVAAQVNGLLLIGAALWIVFEAARRLASPAEVNADGLIGIAVLGLLVNLVATLVLRRAPGDNVNVRAAVLHTMSDAAGSVAAIVAGIAIALWNATWADPAASIAIAVLVVIGGVRLLLDTTHLLLEATPKHLRPEEVEAALLEAPSVVAVHHLHMWALTPDDVALSAHIELLGPTALHDAQREGLTLKAMLSERFGIDHSTLELECHPCEPAQQQH